MYEDLEIKNIYGNIINIDINTVCGLVSDEEEVYFSNTDKLKIYNAECPAEELKSFVDKIGRQQAIMQIEALLDSVRGQEFK